MEPVERHGKEPFRFLLSGLVELELECAFIATGTVLWWEEERIRGLRGAPKELEESLGLLPLDYWFNHGRHQSLREETPKSLREPSRRMIHRLDVAVAATSSERNFQVLRRQKLR